MGQESVAWVLAYIAAFGLSDTLVAMCTRDPGHPVLLVYYGVILVGSLHLLRRSNRNNASHGTRTDDAAAAARQPAASADAGAASAGRAAL